MCRFRDDLSKLEEFDDQTIGISVDLPYPHKAFAEKYGIKFPLLSDAKREVIRLYDVVHEEIFRFRQMAKMSISIMDKRGVIRYKWVSDHRGNEPPYEGILEALKKIGANLINQDWRLYPCPAPSIVRCLQRIVG